ncbi:MAG: rhomboid family intramembrane serine protease [Tannerella sp.]|jgi:membrane associated rhomboid family serine protease|nr:rhomboid family intramembrane serine protease [Tannerella sp.]
MGQNSFNSFGNLPTITKNLIIINLIMWLGTMFLPRLESMLALYFPASPYFRFWQIVSYMFMHAGIAHIFFNMFAVYMFGSVLERTWGEKRFLIYYFVTGIGAALVNMLVIYLRIRAIESQLSADAVELVYSEGASVLAQGKNYIDALMGSLNGLINAQMVGASGAVFGILLAFGMLYPNVEMFIFPIPFPIKAKYLVAGYGAIELFAGLADFSFDHIAHFAHLGGMLFGIILVLYWKKKDKYNGRYFY